MLERIWRKGNLPTLWWECKLVQPLWKTVWRSLRKLKIGLPYELATWRKAWQPTPVFLPGESPWTEEPGGLQCMRWQRVGPNWVTKHSTAQHSSDRMWKRHFKLCEFFPETHNSVSSWEKQQGTKLRVCTQTKHTAHMYKRPDQHSSNRQGHQKQGETKKLS